jgi:hypothetical protein
LRWVKFNAIQLAHERLYKLLCARNDTEISPVDVETEVSDEIGCTRVQAQVRIIVEGGSNAFFIGSQVSELAGHVSSLTIFGCVV